MHKSVQKIQMVARFALLAYLTILYVDCSPLTFGSAIKLCTPGDVPDCLWSDGISWGGQTSGHVITAKRASDADARLYWVVSSEGKPSGELLTCKDGIATALVFLQNIATKSYLCFGSGTSPLGGMGTFQLQGLPESCKLVMTAKCETRGDHNGSHDHSIGYKVTSLTISGRPKDEQNGELNVVIGQTYSEMNCPGCGPILGHRDVTGRKPESSASGMGSYIWGGPGAAAATPWVIGGGRFLIAEPETEPERPETDQEFSEEDFDQASQIDQETQSEL